MKRDVARETLVKKQVLMEQTADSAVLATRVKATRRHGEAARRQLEATVAWQPLVWPSCSECE